MNLRVLIPVFGLALACAATGVATAQPADLSVLAASPDSALVATLAGLPGERLHLDDAVALAAVQAAAAGIAQARLSAAEGAVRREKGAFDPELFGAADWSGADTPSASLFAGADVLQTETSEFSAGARLRTRLGTELTASLNSVRATSNSTYAALEPEYRSFGELSLRQPLLKGFGPSAAGDLAYAESSLQAADARFAGTRLAVRAQVETTFWELYAAERNHAVTRLIRDRASAFLAETRLRAQAGLIGPSQVANAEFFLTEAEQSVLDTEEQLDRLSDRLASLTGRRPAALRFRTGDNPPTEFPLVDQDSLVVVALERNHELQALARETEAMQARARGAAWDARPTLDLVGALGGNGLSGDPQDVFFPGSATAVRTDISGDRGDAMSQAFGRDYPTWQVGLVFALPLGNREGRGERDRWRAETVRAEQVLLDARRGFEEQIRAQHRELVRGRQRMEIATRGVAASIRQVEIGMLEYRNGRSTAFEIVRLAADLATAQQRYSDALVRTTRAAALLGQLTGGWYPAAQN